MIARYTDGTIVEEGDLIRFHEHTGGLLAPPSNDDGSIKWHEGIAAKSPLYQQRREELLALSLIDPDELRCKISDTTSLWYGSYLPMAGHVIERLPAP